MLKKYPSIYPLQLIHGRQARQVYADKANEKANLLADSCTKTAFDRSRQERITSIIGPIGTGEARHSLAVCRPIFINLRLAILIQSSDSIYVKNTDKSSVSAVFSGSGIQIECV
ncbi:hypothetical protein [Lactobacillus delbrueckii]|uniref:hypothetical protein n=1 Tax=Lactobacillus delbrueckii TaxID=1584 RepID=UPI0021A39598|nr:hypothetical protein [Lactobacillus delbrueckii]